MGVWKSRKEFPNPYNWSGYIVGQILSKPEYMGHTVNFRSHKASYKDKSSVPNPKEEWLIFENTHEAIVDKETWELAQKLRKTPKRIDTIGEANPLTGLLYCADCGEKMYNHRSRGGTAKNPYPSDFFDCSSYTLAHQKRTHACSGHYIRTKAVRELILETIRVASAFAVANQDEFMKKVRSASRIRQAEAAKETKRKISKGKKRIAELDTIIKKLYESFAVGRISEDRFDSLLAEYEAEQQSLQISAAEAEQQVSAFEEDTCRAAQFLALAKKYTDFSELTTPMINEFIDKIIVHAPEKIDGDRVQEVEIYLKFIGRFELPVPELTPEEVRLWDERISHDGGFTQSLFDFYSRPLSDKIWEAQRYAIRRIADRESCVLVGRNADYILREFEHVLRVFIYADRDWRICHMESLMLDVSRLEIEADTRSVDRARRSYCMKYTGQTYGYAGNYDLTVNTGSLGFDKAAELVCSAAEMI